MAAISESGFLGGADYTAHASFSSTYTDEGTAVNEADYDTNWGAGNAQDWATALSAIHKWMRGDSAVTGSPALFGGNVSLDSAGATLVIGDESGGAFAELRKGGASTSAVSFFAAATQPSANDKRLLHDTDETWKLQDYTGAVWQTAMTVDNSAQVDFPKAVTMGANLTLDSASPTLTVGAGSGGVVQEWNKGDANEVNLRLRSASVTRGAVRLLSDETMAISTYNGSGVLVDQAVVDGSANWDLPANLTLDSASPIHALGDDTGGPITRYKKADASNSSWADVFSGGSRYWDCLVDSSEDWRISRYIAGTLQESDTLVIKNTDGEVQVANNMNLTNDAPRLTMGNGASDPRLIRDKDGATDGFDEWKSDSLRRWLGWYFNSNENLETRRYNSSEVFQDTPISIDQSNGEVTFPNEIQATLGMDATGATVNAGQVHADSDNGGIVSTTALTNATGGTAGNAATLGNWHVAAASGTFTGWIKIYVGTQAAWVPYWV